jgi:hypothetical protein
MKNSGERFFISGPMSGIVGYNRPAFYEAEKQIQFLYPKAFIYNPARLHWDDGHAKDYMHVNLPMLLTCTTLLLLIGYKNSKGAMIEKALAEYCNIKILIQRQGERSFDNYKNI